MNDGFEISLLLGLDQGQTNVFVGKSVLIACVEWKSINFPYFFQLILVRSRLKNWGNSSVPFKPFNDRSKNFRCSPHDR